MLDKRSHMPLYAQLKDELADCIKHGTMSVGSQIQTEAELMKQYGVGRATVREAVAGTGVAVVATADLAGLVEGEECDGRPICLGD
jgi:hypothetical protein